jgi:GGDEF domain-containing protein
VHNSDEASEMIDRAIQLVSELGMQTAEQLAEIESKLNSVVGVKDIRLLQERVSECKVLLTQESNRIRNRAADELTLLRSKQEMELSGTGERAVTYDPATGLPDRLSAEAAIARGLREGKDLTVAVFVIGKMGWIRARFGKEVGDDVQRTVAEHIRPRMPEESSLFYWGGASFLALLDRSKVRGTADRDLRDIATQPLEKTIDTISRNVLLPITLSCSILRTGSNPNCSQVIGKVEETVAAIMGSDPSQINSN